MRVLVDTSAWVDFANGHPSREADALGELIRDEADIVTCGVIVSEFLQGIRNRESIETLERHFRDMEWLTPREPETYLTAAALFRNLRARGITVRSTIDCLIACLAEENGTFLLSKDRDLRHILDSGLVCVHPFPLPR